MQAMHKLLVVGGGKMGEALVGGLVGSGWAQADVMAVVEPSAARRQALAEAVPGLTLLEGPEPAEGALLAVKPNLVIDVCRQLGDLAITRVLSIAAGVGLAKIEAALPPRTAVVRAMPNTPALVGRGAAALAAGSAATAADMAWARQILSAVGLVVEVSESQLDAVTGLSGSGPAYVFLMAEALIDAGVEQGLTRAVASQLAIETIGGAAQLMAGGSPPAELRAAVTSPGGTTAAGLRALEVGGVRAAFAAAVEAATERSRQLG